MPEAVKFLRGYLLVRLNGFSPERFFNLCAKKGIVLWDLAPEEGGYVFCVSVAAFRELKPILKKSGTTIKILRKYGLPFALFRYRKRKLFFAGILAAAFLLVYLSGFVWKITVEGNSFYSEETILGYLKEAGISSGIKRKSVDCEMLEALLRSDLEEISWVSVSTDGTKMTVAVSESRNMDAGKEDGESGGIYDLAAEKDAVVSSIMVRAGTPYVEAGTPVKAGDLLVGARIDLYNDGGEVYDWEYTRADADVYGLCEEPYEDAFDLAYRDKEFTGGEQRSLTVRIGKYAFTLGGIKKYEYDETLSKHWQLRLGTNLYLPIFIDSSRHFEYVPVQKTYTEEEARQLAEHHFHKFCEKLMENGIQIVEKNVMIETTASQCRAKGSVRTIEPIAVQKECEVVEFPAEEGQMENGTQ